MDFALFQRASMKLVLVGWILPLSFFFSSPMAPAQPPESTQPAGVTVEDITEALEQLEQSADLDDEAKGQIKEVYEQARSMLGKAALERGEAAKFKSWAENAEQDIFAANRQKESPQAYDFGTAKFLELNELSGELAALEQSLSDAKKELADAQAEPQRRVGRIKAIPTDLSDAQTAVTDLKEKIDAAGTETDPAPAAVAQNALFHAQLQFQQATIERLENERTAYSSQGEFPQLRIDALKAQINQLESDVLKLVDDVTQASQNDAQQQRQDAKEAFDATPLSLQKFAQAVIDHADRRFVLASHIRDAAALREKNGKQLARWQEDFERTKKRTEDVGIDSIGLMLVEKRSELPSDTYLTRMIAEADETLNVYRTELYDLEDRRAVLSDVAAAAEKTVEELQEDRTDLPVDADEQLQRLFKIESRVIDSLIKDAKHNYTLRAESRDDQQQLVDLVKQYRRHIDGRIFWLPNARPLSPRHFSDAVRSLGWIFNRTSLADAMVQMRWRIEARPFRSFFLVTLIAMLFLFRSRIKRRLEHLGDEASRISCRMITPTVRSIALTLMLALPWPLLVWFFAQSLAGASSEPVRAVSSALFHTFWWWFTFSLVREIWRPSGLAESHFGWSISAPTQLKRFLLVLIVAGTPLAFFGSVFQGHGSIAARESLSRLCLIGLLLLVSVTLVRFFRSDDDDGDDTEPADWLQRYGRPLRNVAIFTPIALAILATIGYLYTAYELTLDFVYTFSLAVVLFVLQAFLFRCVRIARRKIRWQQLVQRRDQGEIDEESDVSDIDALVAKEGEADLVVMDRQTRRLITLVLGGVAMVGISLIWLETYPALAKVGQLPINPFFLDTGTDEPVTIGALAIALLVVVLTSIAWRNLPGLVDVLLLGRLGVESSIRYAITTISQYAIGILGVVCACAALRISWGQLQWLVAAMGVGLGFGLQEIVANFVCGVLLLFERPIRVGDIVTLGDTTGVVIRIRTRATTVRNWDRQEVVIPNKELITSRITNWTLSDDMNRITVQIGVAYGTDTERVRKLLRTLLEENPNIMDDPRPLVSFEYFGDSTLHFVVRAYLEDMDDRLETIHQVHTTIHQRFNEEGIEIAFPQLDLHLRSIDPTVQMPQIRTEGQS